MEEGEDIELPWPGFVDILSAVLLVFVFLVMITFVIISVSDFDRRKKLKEYAEQQIDEEVNEFKESILSQIEKSIGDYQNQREDLLESIVEINLETVVDETILAEKEKNLVEELAQLKADMPDGQDQEVFYQSDNDRVLYIVFKGKGITLNEESKFKLQEYIDKFGDTQYLMETPDNPKISIPFMAREFAFARSLNVRNAFLDKDIPRSNVNIKYIKANAIRNSFNWVRITAQ